MKLYTRRNKTWSTSQLQSCAHLKDGIVVYFAQKYWLSILKERQLSFKTASLLLFPMGYVEISYVTLIFRLLVFTWIGRVHIYISKRYMKFFNLKRKLKMLSSTKHLKKEMHTQKIVCVFGKWPLGVNAKTGVSFQVKIRLLNAMEIMLICTFNSGNMWQFLPSRSEL